MGVGELPRLGGGEAVSDVDWREDVPEETRSAMIGAVHGIAQSVVFHHPDGPAPVLGYGEFCTVLTRAMVAGYRMAAKVER